MNNPDHLMQITNVYLYLLLLILILLIIYLQIYFFFPEEEMTQPLPDIIPSAANRYQSSPPSLNLLTPALGPIGQPYSADICSYGPVYHTHNLAHAYTPGYGPDKSVRPGPFTRPVYQYHQTYYGPGNVTVRAQNPGAYPHDFGQR